jgi:uncharacterized protein YndB with AHSA1/START domain
MNDAAPAPSADSRVMVAKRFFAAPRALVFRLWSDRTHLENWWGPHGFTTETETFEFRPGGIWRHTMIGPDGTRHANETRFVAIEAPFRIVYDHLAPAFRSTITFTERDGGTEVTVRIAFPSAADRRRVTEQYGAEQGLAQTLERLGETLADAAVEVAFERVFPVSRATMFRMWTEAGHLQQWWGPRGFTNPECQFEPRPGGAIFILMRAPDGTDYPMGGEVLTITPPSHLVFDARALAPDGSILLESHTEVQFQENPAGCLVHLRARGVARDLAALRMLAGMREGWSLSLDRLENHATTTAERVLLIERRFNAPPEAVFRAWTDPALARGWMGPPNYTATIFEPATSAGEPWRACLVNDATGEENWQSGVLIAANEPSHLAMTFAWDRADGSRSPETLITIDFIAEGQGTLMRFRQEGFASVPARDNHNFGWTGCFDRLEQLVLGTKQ